MQVITASQKLKAQASVFWICMISVRVDRGPTHQLYKSSVCEWQPTTQRLS